jgi:hypothetical protein
VVGAAAAASSSAVANLLAGLAEALFDRGTAPAIDGDTGDTADVDLALSPPALKLLLPILAAVLEDPATPADAQTALRIVSAHADVPIEEEGEVSQGRPQRSVFLSL